MKIYKYQPNNNGEVEIPIGYVLLSIQLQNNEPTMWAAVEENAKKEIVPFYAIPTGGEVRNAELSSYKATLIGDNGMVWHVFIGNSIKKS